MTEGRLQPWWRPAVSPCQPANMESVFRKWADGDILQISPHLPPAAIWVITNDNEKRIFKNVKQDTKQNVLNAFFYTEMTLNAINKPLS